MSQPKIIAVRVKSVTGHCAAGHKVGDEWLIQGGKTPAGICMSAFNAIYPNIRVLTFGGSFPWSTEEGVTSNACPDPNNPVVFELRRIQK